MIWGLLVIYLFKRDPSKVSVCQCEPCVMFGLHNSRFAQSRGVAIAGEILGSERFIHVLMSNEIIVSTP